MVHLTYFHNWSTNETGLHFEHTWLSDLKGLPACLDILDDFSLSINMNS